MRLVELAQAAVRVALGGGAAVEREHARMHSRGDRFTTRISLAVGMIIVGKPGGV